MDKQSLATSDFTFTRDSPTSKNMQSGGFFGLNLFGNNNNDNLVNVLILEELYEDNLDMAAYLITKAISHDACPNVDHVCPNTGCTLLQCLIRCAHKSEKLYHALEGFRKM